jgi:hypothetical protein
MDIGMVIGTTLPPAPVGISKRGLHYFPIATGGLSLRH